MYLFTDCKSLIDIDECALNMDDCDQLCVDDLESYHCECYDGYFRDTNSSSCVGKYVCLSLYTDVYMAALCSKYKYMYTETFL